MQSLPLALLLLSLGSPTIRQLKPTAREDDMTTLDRRDFTLTLASASLGLLPRPRLSALRPPVQHKTPYIRHNIYCLTATSPEIVAYKRAIQVMRAKSATDPTSWQAQSNIHGAFKPDPARGVVNVCPPATAADLVAPAGMIADACRHDYLFLAWHRMYIYYFERIVRAASGDPTFALPYWGYSPGGPHNLPDVFRIPGTTMNPLWTDQRLSAINTGSDITATFVDAGPALAIPGFVSFQSSLRSVPHNVVHTSVGGGCGWMSAFETAGMDPIFWLHHCNIDRLWDDWITMGGGRANPTTDPTWMNQTFTFYDEAGATVNLRVDQILDTATQLDYRYAPPTVCPTRYFCFCFPRRPWLLDPRLVALADTIVSRRPLPQPFTVAQAPAPIPLGATAREVRVPIPAAGRDRLLALPRDSAAGTNIKLVFDDIRLEQNPAVAYEVYVNLPAGEKDTVYTSPHFVGVLDFFGSAHPDRRQLQREFDLLLPFVRLRQMQRWPMDTLRVTLVPKPLVEGGRIPRAISLKRQATIGRISIVVE